MRTYQVLYYDSMGSDWKEAREYKAVGYIDAAKQFAEDYYKESSGEWEDNDTLDIQVACYTDGIKIMRIHWVMTQDFYAEEVE